LDFAGMISATIQAQMFAPMNPQQRQQQSSQGGAFGQNQQRLSGDLSALETLTRIAGGHQQQPAMQEPTPAAAAPASFSHSSLQPDGVAAINNLVQALQGIQQQQQRPMTPPPDTLLMSAHPQWQGLPTDPSQAFLSELTSLLARATQQQPAPPPAAPLPTTDPAIAAFQTMARLLQQQQQQQGGDAPAASANNNNNNNNVEQLTPQQLQQVVTGLLQATSSSCNIS
jgi:hypothetical protein